MLAAVGIGAQMFPAIFQPADRPAQAPRQPGNRNFFAQQKTLVSKAAADIRSDHADAAVGNTKAVGDAILHDVGHLC